MTVTPAALTRTAGLCAAASGLIYGLIQFIHPDETLEVVGTGAWAFTSFLTMVMAVLGLAGLTGLYLRQVRAAGVLGLVGYLFLGGFYLTVVSFSLIEVLVLPELTDDAPRFVTSFLGIFAGEDTGDLGAVTVANPVAAVLYLAGGVCFGIASFRARILSRWASVLLAAGTTAALAVPLLPHAAARMAAIPVGVALIGLGIALWRDPRPAGGAADAVAARPDTLGVR